MPILFALPDLRHKNNGQTPRGRMVGKTRTTGGLVPYVKGLLGIGSHGVRPSTIHPIADFERRFASSQPGENGSLAPPRNWP